MTELSIDFTRCVGIDVCGSRACEESIGEGFFRVAERDGFIFVSRQAAEDNSGRIAQALRRCPAGAINLRRCVQCDRPSGGEVPVQAIL